ncbi:MAG: hypothetical protein K2J88_05590, partial [Oscillospiraceae bacterium]|nr:hypothetical protein [Oscillospiraceae bacterium]
MQESKQETQENSSSEIWKQQLGKFIWTFLTIAAAILFYYLIQYLGSISKFFLSVMKGISPV